MKWSGLCLDQLADGVGVYEDTAAEHDEADRREVSGPLVGVGLLDPDASADAGEVAPVEVSERDGRVTRSQFGHFRIGVEGRLNYLSMLRNPSDEPEMSPRRSNSATSVPNVVSGRSIS